MNNIFIYFSGLCLVFGLVGGWELLGRYHSFLNTISKDQVSILFGITWLWIGVLAIAFDRHIKK